MKKILLFTLVSALMVGCGGGGGGSKDNSPDSDGTPKSSSLDLTAVTPVDTDSGLPENWHEGAVFMEIYVRGYSDSDGDGIGDFNGLTEKLDYLKDLGITGIWLMPITESQDHDHGYAVADYRRVESQYGTQADFQNFLDEAHQRGIGVIIDYVANHSAAENPLFQDSANNFEEFRDWYVWEDNNLGWTNWNGDQTWHSLKGDYYYAVFWDQMPDWNLLKQEVIDYHHNNLRYWLNLRVDGFRFDAVGQFVENGADAYERQPENHQILTDSKEIINGQYSNRFLICEEPGDPVGFSSDNSCGSTFAFGLNYAIVDSIQQGQADTVFDILQKYPLEKMGIILSNHDSFAGDRIIHQLNNNIEQYKAAAATLLTLPGRPFVYYGEEVGMGHSQGNSGDWALRAPMSWTASGGFTTGKPFRNPAINLADFNTEDQVGVDGSLHTTYKTLIKLRNQNPALKTGSAVLLAGNEVIAYNRVSTDQEIIAAINYSDKNQSVDLATGRFNASWTYLYPDNGGQAGSSDTGEMTVSLAPYEFVILEMAQ